jgi:hypothetical protein
MSDLIMARGGEYVTRDQLDLIKLPDSTDTFTVVSHFDLANRVLEISNNIIRDYALVSETYGIARQGNQLFAVLNFKGEEPDMALSVAYRNSLDKSMAIAVATGASVFCCSNLSISGDIVVMRKHSKHVFDDLEDLIISTLYKSMHRYQEIVADASLLRGKPLSDDDAFRAMGLMFGRDLIGPRQLTVIKDEWLKPSHVEFTDRNLWSYYNAVTESLKSTPPPLRLERQVNCHKQIMALTA